MYGGIKCGSGVTGDVYDWGGRTGGWITKGETALGYIGGSG